MLLHSKNFNSPISVSFTGEFEWIKSEGLELNAEPKEKTIEHEFNTLVKHLQ